MKIINRTVICLLAMLPICLQNAPESPVSASGADLDKSYLRPIMQAQARAVWFNDDGTWGVAYSRPLHYPESLDHKPLIAKPAAFWSDPKPPGPVVVYGYIWWTIGDWPCFRLTDGNNWVPVFWDWRVSEGKLHRVVGSWNERLKRFEADWVERVD